MSLSADAAAFTPPSATSESAPPSSSAPQQQHQRGGHAQQQQRGGRGGNNRGRGGGGRGGANNQQNHESQPQQNRGGRGRGGSNRGGRGGGRGGQYHNNNNNHHSSPQQYQNSQSSPALSPADAAAIEAVMLSDALSASTSATSHSPPIRSTSSSNQPLNSADLSRSLLLGFHHDPHPSQQAHRPRPPKKVYTHGRPAEVFSQAQYMSATHHFLLGEDDPASFLLADHPVDWNKVELVIEPVDDHNATKSCPICLDPPVAAKMTKCGHIYCDTCIHHYLSQSDKSWARCPLCFVSVYPQALKSAEFRVQQKVAEGDHVEFVLMRRFKDTINPVPVVPIPNSSASIDTFSRIALTTDIGPIVQRELRELFALRRISRSTNDEITLKFIDRAEEAIVKRIENWETRHPHWKMKPSFDEMKDEELKVYERDEEERAREREKLAAAKNQIAQSELWPSLPSASVPKNAATSSRTPSNATAASASDTASSTPLESPTLTAAPTPITSSPTQSSVSASSSSSSSAFFDTNESYAESQFRHQLHKNSTDNSSAAPIAGSSPPKRTTSQPSSGPPLDSVYYFYAAIDGQQLFLHSLNYRSLLLSHNNDVRQLPPRIRGRIIYKDSYVMDASIRSKYRFLSNLPLTTSFALTVVELNGGLVTPTVQQTMASEFAADRKSRQLAAKKQRELNKRTIQSSKAAAAAEGGNVIKASDTFKNWKLMEEDPASFPDLAPTAATAASSSTSSTLVNSSGSPELRAKNWNVVAERGMASSELWPSIETVASAPATAVTGGWGSSSVPLSARPSGPRWGQSSSSVTVTSNRRKEEEEAYTYIQEELPPPTINRKGQTTLLSTTGGRRSYK